jgi:hypothetical protein
MTCFSYPDGKQLACFCLHSVERPDGDKVTTRGKSVVFRRCKFCFVDMHSHHKVPLEGCSWTLNYFLGDEVTLPQDGSLRHLAFGINRRLT